MTIAALKRQFIIGLSVIALAISAVVVPVGEAAQAAPATDMTAFAHRGAYRFNITDPASMPNRPPTVDENSLTSFRQADEVNANIETDIHMTLDRGFLIMHDANMGRVTDNCRGTNGVVAEKTLAEIRAQCTLKIRNEKIPTFADLAVFLKFHPTRAANVELKGTGWFDDDNGDGTPNDDLTRIAQVARDQGVLGRVYFSEDATTRILEAFRDYIPDAKTTWKPEGTNVITIAQARAFSVNSVMAHYPQWTNAASNTPAEFQAAGFGTWGRLTNTRERRADGRAGWEDFRRIGVNRVLTDFSHWNYWANN